MKRGTAFRLMAFFLVYTNLLWPTLVLADVPGAAGFVTSLQGKATVAHAAQPEQPQSLKFKDPVFGRDRISTKEQSVARVLLGGKALITVRELSELTITEEPGKPSIVDIARGKIAMVVAHERMKAGEAIQVRTPNAVAAVRGTVLIVEVEEKAGSADGPPDYRPARASYTGQAAPVQAPNVITNFHILQGSVAVSSLAQPGAPPVELGAGLSLSVIGGNIGQPQTSPPTQQLIQGLVTEPPHSGTPSETNETIATNQLNTASNLGEAITGGTNFTTGQTTTNLNTNVVLSTTGTTITTESSCPICPNPPIVTFAGFRSSVTLTAPLGLVEDGEVTTPPTPLSLPNAAVPGPDATILPIGSTPGSGELVTPYYATAAPDQTVDLPGGIGLTNTDVHAGGHNVFQFGSGQDPSATLHGIGLLLNNSTIDGAGSIVDIDNASLTGTSTGELVSLSGNSSITDTNNLVTIRSGGALTLISPALSAANSMITVYSDLISVDGTSSLTTNVTSNPTLVALSNSSLSANGSVLHVDDGGQATLAGPLLAALSNASVTAEDILRVESGGTLTSTGTGSLINLNGSSFTSTCFGGCGAAALYGTATLAGPLLSATNATIQDVTLLLVGVGGTLTSNGTGPLMSVTGSTVLAQNLVYEECCGATLTLKGSLFSAVNSTITLSSDAIVLDDGEGSSTTNTGTGALVALNHSALTANGSLLKVFGCCEGGLAMVGGALTATNGSSVGVTDDVVSVSGGSFLGVASALPLVALSASALSAESLLGVSNATAILDGSALLAQSGSTIVASDNLIYVGGGGSLTAEGAVALVDVSGSTLTMGESLLHLDCCGDSATMAGPLLQAVNTPVTAGSDLIFVGQNTSLTGQSPFALVILTNSPLTAGGSLLNMSGCCGASMSQSGPLLSATGSLISVGSDFIYLTGDAEFSSTATAALVTLTSSPLIANGSFVRLTDFDECCNSMTLAGPLLAATNSPVSLVSHFIYLTGDAELTSTATTALVTLSSSPLLADGALVRLTSSGTNSLILAGPLLSATNSPLALRAGLAFTEPGSSIVLTGSTPFTLVTLTGGVHNIDGEISPAMFLFQGNGSTDPVISRDDGETSGLPLGAPLLTTSGAVVNSSRALNLDSALLQASAPLFNFTAGSSMAFGSDFIRLSNANLTANVPASALAALNASTLTVNGSLVRVGENVASTMDVTGSLFSLNNGSRLNILTAPLVTVSNGSTFTLTGSFGTFGPTGINVLNLPTTVSALLNCSGCTLNTTFIPGFAVALENGASTDQITITGTFVPFASLGGTSRVTAGGIVLLLDGDSALVVLNGTGGTAAGTVADANIVNTHLLVVDSETGPLTNPVLTATDKTVTVVGETEGPSNPILVPSGETLDASAVSSPLISLTNSPMTSDGSVLAAIAEESCCGTTNTVVTLGGPLLSANASPINTGGGDVIFLSAVAEDGEGSATAGTTLTSATASPLVTLTNSQLASGGGLLHLSSSATANCCNDAASTVAMTLHGPLLSATGSPIGLQSDVIAMSASASDNVGGPTVVASSSFTGIATTPLVSLTNSLLSADGSFLNLDSSAFAITTVSASGTVEMTLHGPLLSATDSPITLGGDVIRLFASADGECCATADAHASLTGTATGALVSLTNSPLATVGSFLNLSTETCCPGDTTAEASVTIGGPLLSAVNSNLTIAGPLVRVWQGAELTTNSSLPLVTISGGVHAIGVNPLDCAVPTMFDLRGNAVAAFDTGIDDGDGGTVVLNLGTDRPLKGPGATGCPTCLTGPVLQATGAAITTSQAVTIDAALLEATAPLIQLVSSTMTSNSDLIYLANAARMDVNVPSDALVGLNASTLNILNGSLVNVAGGSYLNVTGNLVSLTGGSTLNILNGGLVTVSGGSAFSLTGSLVNFGTGTNALNITNNASLCGGCTLTTTIPNLAGVPVLLMNGATAAHVLVSPSFTALAGLGGNNTVNYTGPSAALVVLNGATSRIRLRP